MSVGPNHTSSRGMNDAAGRYREADMVGLMRARSFTKHPMAIPIGTATAQAAKKLAKMR